MPTEGEWEEVKRDDFDEGFQMGGYVMCSGDKSVALGHDPALARRIVTAVNCHEELVALVEGYREYMEGLMGWTEIDDKGKAEAEKELALIDAALAKAREKK